MVTPLMYAGMNQYIEPTLTDPVGFDIDEVLKLSNPSGINQDEVLTYQPK